MTAWLLLLAILALGFAAARAAWPAPPRWSSADPLRLAAAPVLGLGLASGLYFFLRIAAQLAPAAVIGAVAALTAATAALAWTRARSAEPDPDPAPGAAPIWLWALLGIAAAIATATFLMLHAAAPHGEWDAWSIWDLRARFLFRAQEFASPFTPALDWAHPDYPLLLPAAIALLWHAAGAESPAIAAAVNFLFLASLLAAPFCALRLLRGPGLAAVAAIATLSATSLVRVSASLYADVPLAGCAAVAAALLVYGLERGASGPILLAGLAGGFAAWTKNEGILFCISLLAALFVSVTSLAELRTRLRPAVPLLAGIAVAMVAVAWFKLRIAPPNDLVNGANLAVSGAKIAVFDRYWMTFWAFVGELLTFGNVLVPPVIVFAVWLALVRFRPAVNGAQLLPLTLATLQLAGYFFVYVLTSKDLDWHLNTSLPRLLLHVWPLAVTGIFLVSNDIFPPSPQLSRPSARSK